MVVLVKAFSLVLFKYDTTCECEQFYKYLSKKSYRVIKIYY